VSDPSFEIEILEQGWKCVERGGESPYDVCSHGDIRLVIGGRTILPDESKSGSYAVDRASGHTINTTALALLRTLEADHSRRRPVADRLILHCGGTILSPELSGCPIGVDWRVRHLGDRVRLDQVVRYPSVYVKEAERFRGLAVELSEDEYRQRIARFAHEARQPFLETEKIPEEGLEYLYDEFWQEYDERLSRAID
jgi:hypothetical protein